MKPQVKSFLIIVLAGLGVLASTSVAIVQGRSSDRQAAYYHGAQVALAHSPEHEGGKLRECALEVDPGELLDRAMTYDQAYDVGQAVISRCGARINSSGQSK